MIELIPAIDIINGSCVRLAEGDFARKTDYDISPVEMAGEFASAGFRRLHVVDLDGARSGSPVHVDLLKDMCGISSLTIDYGGGIRTTDQFSGVLDAGAGMVSIGSIAVKDPGLVEGWIEQFGADSIFLGADVKNNLIATHGWARSSGLEIMEYLAYWVSRGIQQVFCTDVSKDGMLTGPATELYISIKKRFPDLYLVASGGVANVDDIQQLEDSGIDAVIFGKAFYEGKITYDNLKKWL